MAKRQFDTPAVTPASTPRALAEDRSRAGEGEQVQPTHDEIAEAAYHRYLTRGGADGQDLEDWMEAERELRAQRALR